MLEVRGLTKRYADLVALDDLHLDVPDGRCVALVGHNGSGKSTAVRCLTAQLRPTAGEVRIAGMDGLDEERGERVRSLVSYVGDAPAFYPDLTAREHIELVALAHGLGTDTAATVDRLLDELDLTERAGFRPDQLSAGMRQKAHLACGLVRPFELLVLDEPASNLDAGSAEWLRTRIAADLDRGAAVVLTSHDAAFMDGLVDEVVLLEDGRTATVGDLPTALASDAAARAGLAPPSSAVARGGPTPPDRPSQTSGPTRVNDVGP